MTEYRHLDVITSNVQTIELMKLFYVASGDQPQS
jgi:hypothetical protein